MKIGMVAKNSIEKNLWSKIFKVIVLLVTISILRMVFVALFPFFMSESLLVRFYMVGGIRYVHWGFDIIVGAFVIVWMKEYKLRSLPFGFLAAMTPVIGGIFYLLATTKIEREL